MAEPRDLDILVRSHLDREAERIDPRPVLARILADLPGHAPVRRRSRAVIRWAGVAAAAVALVACLALLAREKPALAKGEAVVREARRAHLTPIDRCYLVEVRRESSIAAEPAPSAPQVRLTRLWTRGDRFWVESARADQRWAWGRDAGDRFWIAFGPHTAVRLEADEVPAWLNLYCDLHSLNVEQLLGDVLDRFDLTRETSAADASTIRISARARALAIPPPGPSVQGAEIEIDAETRIIRRMVVRRARRGQPVATVTYSLLETDARDPAEYRVEGHLSEPFEIFTRDHEPQRRKELLARWFEGRPGQPSPGPDLAK